MKFIKVAILLLMSIAVQSAFAAEAGTLIKSEELKVEPYRDAKTIATLKAGERVDILKKDGGWLNVKSSKYKGWVRMLSVRRGEAKKAVGIADNFKGLTSGRSGTGKVVATTGVRGLNEEELKSAKFDAQELQLNESYLTTQAEAQTFAQQGKLKARSMAYLPLPQ